MAAKYYLLANRSEETPELPFAYETGEIDKDNAAPEGAELFTSKGKLNNAVKSVEKEILEAIDYSTSDEFFEELAKNAVKVKNVKKEK